MRHDLLGYLLGALDGGEQDTIRQQLDLDAGLREQLLDWERRLAKLERQRVYYEPPVHLCEATCQLISQHIATHSTDVREGASVGGGAGAAALAPRPLLTPETRGVATRDWSLMDVVVAAGLFIGAAILFFPAIFRGQQTAIAERCQNNMRLMGSGMAQYGSMHGGLPTPAEDDRWEGLMASVPATLVEAGYMQPEWLVCPASEFSVPSEGIQELLAKELRLISAEDLARVATLFKSSYGFPLGYMRNDAYFPRKPADTPHLALMSDLPLERSGGAGYSHHMEQRINVMFADLSVRELPQRVVTNPSTSYSDDIFVNDEGQVAPGLHFADAVIVPGMLRPDLSRVQVTVPVPSQGAQVDVILESGTR